MSVVVSLEVGTFCELPICGIYGLSLSQDFFRLHESVCLREDKEKDVIVLNLSGGSN